MRYLITGGAGFIGSNLARSLVMEGHDVYILDNFHTGSHENLIGIPTCEGNYHGVIKGGIRDLSSCTLDGIFHLGIPSSTPMYKENNFLMGETINEFIFLLKNFPETKIVFASSSSIYNGIPPPHKEEIEPLVTDFYTETRIAMERLGYLYNSLFGNPVIGLRMFSVYGPHEKAKGKYANMVTQILWKILNDETPVIYGDGTQTRDFIRVEDVVKAFITVMESTVNHGIFNIGTGSSYSFNDIIKGFNLLFKKEIKPEYVKNPLKNYVMHTLADRTWTCKTFPSLKKTIPFDTGLKMSIMEYR